MEALILIGIVTGLPILAIIFLRANAMLVFMSVCVGYVLTDLVYYDANSLLSSFSPKAGTVQLAWIKAILLLAPVTMALLFTVHSIRGHSKQFINIFPAFAAGILLTAFLKPLLPLSLQQSLDNEPVWLHINALQTVAVLVGTGSCLIMMLFAQRARKAALKDKKPGH